MNFLLLLYAMIAGLAGLTPGHSAVARMAAMTQDGAVAGDARGIASQAEIAALALVQRQAIVTVLPVAEAIDARRIAIHGIAPLLGGGRATPERRRE